MSISLCMKNFNLQLHDLDDSTVVNLHWSNWMKIWRYLWKISYQTFKVFLKLRFYDTTTLNIHRSNFVRLLRFSIRWKIPFYARTCSWKSRFLFFIVQSSNRGKVLDSNELEIFSNANKLSRASGERKLEISANVKPVKACSRVV